MLTNRFLFYVPIICLKSYSCVSILGGATRLIPSVHKKAVPILRPARNEGRVKAGPDEPNRSLLHIIFTQITLWILAGRILTIARPRLNQTRAGCWLKLRVVEYMCICACEGCHYIHKAPCPKALPMLSE